MQQKHRLSGKLNHFCEIRTTRTTNTKAARPKQKSRYAKHCKVTFPHTVAYLGGTVPCPSLEITNMRNQRQIPSEDHFFFLKSPKFCDKN